MARPTHLRLRFIKAYWATIVVISSYLWLRFQAMFRSASVIERRLLSLHIKNARRIERTIMELQGLFIKVGQLISILTNLLPEVFRRQLEGVQDAVPPVSYDRIEARIIEAFGKSPHQIFSAFDETPIASASLSQVHLATTVTGERVAVKVQYPEVEGLVRIDLGTFRRIIQLVSIFLPNQGLDTIYQEVSQLMLRELDFEEEAVNLRLISKNFEGDRSVRFPRVFEAYSSKRVLTTEFIDGVKVSSLERLDELNVPRRDVAKMIIDMYCKQIFVDGVYHADPHPGNIFVLPGPQVALVDFGAVATVSPKMRQGIVDFLQGVIHQNTTRIIQALKDMGFVSRVGRGDEEIFERVVDYFHQQFQESIQLEKFSLSEIKLDPEEGLRHLVQLKKLDIGLRELATAFHVPQEWVLLERTLLMLTGICTLLDDSIQPMEFIRPYVEQFVLGKDADWTGFALRITKEIGLEYLAIPAEFKKFLMRASQGRVEVRVRGVGAGARLLYVAAHQLIYAASALTAATLSAVFHIQQMPAERDSARLVAGVFGVMLFVSIVKQWRKSRRGH